MASPQQLTLAASTPASDIAVRGIVARSQQMRDLLRDVVLYSNCDANALILGDTGTGKESIARALHQGHATRWRGPFVSVNCGAIPDGLFESEFFGYTKGAFTGAVTDHAGYLEQAHGGTLFLDELGELPLHQQVKLLRVLEQRTVTRLGSRTPVQVDFRLVAATNRDLRRMAAQGGFRTDLYYRVAVLVFRLPSLDERGPEDKRAIFETILRRLAERNGYRLGNVPEWLLDAVERCHFQGNVRELINLAERVAITCQATGGWNADLLTAMLHHPPGADTAPARSWSAREEAERDRILAHLENHGWRRQVTATALGISRKVLWEKMRKYCLFEAPSLDAGNGGRLGS
ncbi:sigma-54-dependent Fis family transcriptional regulator [Parasulfuritortus cantonensis]|uniref:Sigma-54-dependent Fis family transcriptional regulator n=1 Tax=Parasulfuritortus cantonensis TaxID=2528202 RepID=A0A4V2NW81_9PROT|nr:sigma-54 dependent transcriptional regulator [Parasulfuritortus cantonensis]TCJ16322.1 sigma-54-dependent Fis family transcriptional regulator [Parasulfuritortus cantonensis]